MLKRQQVLINDWLIEHLQAIAKKYDISYSEVVRMGVCMHAIRSISRIYSEHNFGQSEEKIAKIIKDFNKTASLDEAKFHKAISDLYFETRKAVEFWNKEEKKKWLVNGNK